MAKRPRRLDPANPVTKRFGRRVRELRLAKDMTQEQLADVSGLDRSYMGGVERGERNVSLRNIDKIAKALGVSIAALFKSAGDE